MDAVADGATDTVGPSVSNWTSFALFAVDFAPLVFAASVDSPFLVA